MCRRRRLRVCLACVVLSLVVVSARATAGQTYVTPEGEKFFADMIETELRDFGHWELKR